MNIEMARTLPLSDILMKSGAKFAKQSENDEWYYSPFRTERTASFKVNKRENIWYDFGEGKGGDNIAFVCAYLKTTGTGHTVSDALRWLGNMFEGDFPARVFPKRFENKDNSALVLKSVRPLTHIALIKYLEDRGISKEVACKYLKEVSIYNKKTNKEFFAAAIKNEEGGYDYRNLYMKGCIKKKAITFVRGEIPGNGGIHIFEGFMDFLSIIMQRQQVPFNEDTIILNSVSSLKDATAYIRHFGYSDAYTWLDNDEAGAKATLTFGEFFQSENIRHKLMNGRYASFKDVNEAHLARQEL